MSKPQALVQGTLSLLILKILDLEPRTGWAISQRLRQMSNETLQASHGSLYPALHKLEHEGWIRGEWQELAADARRRSTRLTRGRAPAVAIGNAFSGRSSPAPSTAFWNRREEERTMRWLQQLRLKMRAIVLRSRVEREMEAEIAAHVEAETRELTARGSTRPRPAAAPANTMGHVELIKEECRDSRGTTSWEQLKQDVTFGVRLLCKNRTFCCMALATMSLAIGSTTAVFSVVDHVLLRPLPFAAPDRLYHAGDVNLRGHFDALRSNSRLADYAAHLGVRAFNTRGPNWPERVDGQPGLGEFLPRSRQSATLRAQDFAAGTDRPGAPRTAILSNAFWTQRYGARRDVLGRQLVLDDVQYEIIGVMPADFHYPSPDAGFWIPMRLDPRAGGDYWGTNACSTFARLHDGVTPQAAISELRGWTPRVHAMFPWRMPDIVGQ